MSILPFVVIDGGPYRQRLLSGSPHWRPPPTRFMYSSKHATGTHNKPLIKASFWSRFEKTEVAIWSWICVCVCVCVCVRERESKRDRDRDRERDRDRKCMRERASFTSKGKNFVSSVLDHISRVQCLVSTTNRFPETVYWMTVGRNLGGIFWYCEFPWYFFFSFGPCDLYHLGFSQAQNQYIYISRDLLWGISLYYCVNRQSNSKICRTSIMKRRSQAEWGCVGCVGLKHLSTGDISSPCLCLCLSRESWPCF